MRRWWRKRRKRGPYNKRDHPEVVNAAVQAVAYVWRLRPLGHIGERILRILRGDQRQGPDRAEPPAPPADNTR